MLYTTVKHNPEQERNMAETIKDTAQDEQRIRELVAEMKLYNNPQELEDMKKLMKKNVPFAMRGYLMAYLYVTRGSAAAKPAKPQDKKPQQKQAPENTVSFYINVGKMSKGSARELVDFICEKTGLSSEDIVSVAYKQNYSFVYIRKEKAEGIIEAINGQTYKGRKVKMNYSKEKDGQD